MPRYAIKIEYDGSHFHGWQRQNKGLSSVQEAIENALEKLEPIKHRVHGAGRTDAGVHALGQVGSFDLTRDWAPDRLQEALNYYLKSTSISIIAAARVDDNFHARFTAVERRYLFRLVSRRAPMTHDAGRVWHMRHRLDLTAMQQAAQHLIGQHDFTTFRASMCQAKSPVKTIDFLEVREIPYPGNGTEFNFELRARSFLHNQVRSIVGTLERVGAGYWAPDRVKTALDAKSRTACGPVCPPQGLYLTHAVYPTDPFQ